MTRDRFSDICCEYLGVCMYFIVHSKSCEYVAIKSTQILSCGLWLDKQHLLRHTSKHIHSACSYRILYMNIYSCFDTQQNKKKHEIQKTTLLVWRVCNRICHKLRTTQILQHHCHVILPKTLHITMTISTTAELDCPHTHSKAIRVPDNTRQTHNAWSTLISTPSRSAACV